MPKSPRFAIAAALFAVLTAGSGLQTAQAGPYFSVQSERGRPHPVRREERPAPPMPPQRGAAPMPLAPPPPGFQGGQRLTPEQRQELRRQVREANREIYPNRGRQR